MATLICELADAAATERLGALLATLLPAGGLISLQGPLGAGKTTLARGLLRALGHAGRVRSPSYSVLESYDLGDRQVLHLDLYRIADASELDYLGLREQLGASTLLLVEWPQRAAGHLPSPLLDVELAYTDTGRQAVLIGRTPEADALLQTVSSSMANEQCRLTDGLHDESACQ